MQFKLFPIGLFLFFSLSACSQTNSPRVEDSQQKNLPPDASKVTSNWYQYMAQDGSYSVKFPAKPQELPQSVNTQIGPINFVTVFYEDTSKKRAYFTANTKYPIDPKKYDPELGLNGARDNMAKSSNLTVVSEQQINIKGMPGRELLMQGNSGTWLIQLILDGEGPSLYQAFVISGDNNIDFPEARSFLNSFIVQ